MIGVLNRIPNVVCEVGTCVFPASFTEYVKVIPGNPALRHERHEIDIVLCSQHDRQFELDGLAGVVTAYGDQILHQERE